MKGELIARKCISCRRGKTDESEVNVADIYFGFGVTSSMGHFSESFLCISIGFPLSIH